MATRWTARKSGDVRTTVHVRYHVPRDLVSWVAGQLDWTEARALRWVRQHVVTLAGGWHGVYYVAGEDTPSIFDLDHDDPVEDFGATAVYEGPTI